MHFRDNKTTEINMVIIVGVVVFLSTILIAIVDEMCHRPAESILPTVYDSGRSTSVNTGEPPSKRMRLSIPLIVSDV